MNMKKILYSSCLLAIVALVSLGAISSFYIVDDTTGDKIPFGTGGELHFDNISGLPNDITVLSSGSIDTSPYDAHIADDTIHFTESSIDHTAIQNVGTYTHSQIDSHVDDSTIHFTESSIDHTAIQNVGTYTHSQLDSHVDDSTIHFTESSIDHTAIQNVGTYTHSQIDSHIDDDTIHAPINDSLTTATDELWSNDYTKDYVDTHSGSASIPVGTLWMFAGSSAPSGWMLADGSCVSRSTYSDLFAVVGETYDVCDGSTTFGLPDFRGRTGIGAGQGSGLSSRTLGETIGEEEHSLTSSENGPHTHSIVNPFTTIASGGSANWHLDFTADTDATDNVVGSSGSGTPHNTMQPSLVVNYIIKY